MCSCQRGKEFTQFHSLLCGIFLCLCKAIFYVEDYLNTLDLVTPLPLLLYRGLDGIVYTKEEDMEESVSEMKSFQWVN